MLGMNLNFSTSLHFQTDGQRERVNKLLEMYLYHYASSTQTNWANLVNLAQFPYILQQSESTDKSLLEIVTR